MNEFSLLSRSTKSEDARLFSIVDADVFQVVRIAFDALESIANFHGVLCGKSFVEKTVSSSAQNS